MASAKDIIVKVIPANVANAFVRQHHYSGKVVNNSCLHFGCFLKDRLHGVMSFGPPMDKSKCLSMVKGTGWSEMLELNRMAFDEILPKNSESRCLAIVFKLLRKNAPHIKWILSFSDGTQSGDGTIYRASGFALTQIKSNKSIIKMPGGETLAKVSVTARLSTRFSPKSSVRKIIDKYGVKLTGGASIKPFFDVGGKYLEGFQLRYIYLLDKTAKITVPILPYSAIEEAGAGMYRGKKRLGGEKVSRSGST